MACPEPQPGIQQIAPGFCAPKLPQDKTTLNFVKPVNCSKELPANPTGHTTNRPGNLYPEVGPRQNVPACCKAGRRLNKITGKTVKEQNHASHMLTEICLVLFGKKRIKQKHSQKCKDIKITWQFRLVSFHPSY